MVKCQYCGKLLIEEQNAKWLKDSETKRMYIKQICNGCMRVNRFWKEEYK